MAKKTDPPKRSPGRPRRDGHSGLPHVTKALREKNRGKPALFNELTRTYQVYQLMLKGYNHQEIAEQLNVTPNDVTQLLTAASQQLTREIQLLRAQWTDLSLARVEFSLKLLLEYLENPKQELDAVAEPSHRTIESLFKAIRLQGEILGVMNEQASKPQNPQNTQQQVNVYIEPTMNGSGKLYKEAAAAEQLRLAGTTLPQLTESAVERDPKVSRLDQLRLTDEDHDDRAAGDS